MHTSARNLLPGWLRVCVVIPLRAFLPTPREFFSKESAIEILLLLGPVLGCRAWGKIHSYVATCIFAINIPRYGRKTTSSN
ncbi:hypothetical protein I7I48_03822 [Histoplasma ohiense]|nr:hypothetical protein I7I48_03822 [Histoplasma ohiense (nom. inval.)]